MAITRPLDYKGCDPEIEKALRANMAISCYVSDCYEKPSKEINEEVEIVAYVQGNDKGPYLDSDGCSWEYAIPTKDPVKWIMPPEKAIPILIREGWKFDERGSLFKRVGAATYYLNPIYLKGFGTMLSESPAFTSDRLSCIIEEK